MIIFARAKKVSDGDWIKGSEVFDKRKGISYIIDLSGLIEGTLYESLWFVDQKTVGYGINITDKNGHSIFVDDIVEIRHLDMGEIFKIKGKVVIQSGCAGVVNKKGCFVTFHAILKEAIDILIIGNIHDNPEKWSG